MKDADAVRNLVEIVKQHKDEDIFLVVSAMGKTTNMLEKALKEVRGERDQETFSFDNGSLRRQEHQVYLSLNISCLHPHLSDTDTLAEFSSRHFL